jgi:hypothetical protein
LSKSGRDNDGIWPLAPVRDVLEEIGNEKIAQGMVIGLMNQRGAQWRDVGGRQERELAAQYRNWSQQTAVEWPFTSRLLALLAENYDSQAVAYDASCCAEAKQDSMR